MAKISLTQGGRTVNGKQQVFNKATGSYMNPPQAARGDDFAENMQEASKSFGSTPEKDVKEFGSVSNATERSYGYSPTVLSNANKIERVIPLLDSQASNLSFNLSDTGGSNFTNVDSGDSFGGGEEDNTFEEILGLAPKKKKKDNRPSMFRPETLQRGQTQSQEVLDPYTAQQMSLLQSMQKAADAQAQQALSTIQEKFTQRQLQQERANQQGMASIKQVLNLGGSSRYAPISSQGIISAAEAAGIRALSELDSQEQQAIGEIKAAQQANDFQLLEKKMNLLENVRAEKAKTTAELQKAQQETDAQMEMDNFIATEIGKGNTNPIEIFNAIRAAGGNVPLSNITSALEGVNKLSGAGGIGGTGFKLDNKAIGQLLGNGFTAPDITAMQADLNAGASIDDILGGLEPDMQNVVKEAFGVKTDANMNLKPGVGAQTPTEEAFIRTRLFAKIAPILNKGQLSDDDRQIIDGRIAEFRDAGFGEQEILDTLAGLPPEVNTPYNSTFRDLIVSNSETMEKQTMNIGRLSQQLQKGNYQQAMNTVENLAMTEAKKLDPDNYLGTGTARFALKQAKDLKDALVGAEDVLGPLEGTFQNVLGKLAKSKDPRAAKISAKITKLTAPMRNQLSGTAVTASETTFLEPLIPSLSDTIDNLYIKANELESQTLDRHNSTRSMVSLPTVTSEMGIDPKKRLQLYSNDIYLPANGQLDI